MTNEQLEYGNKIARQLAELRSAKISWETCKSLSEVKLAFDGFSDSGYHKYAFPDFDVVRKMALDNINNQIEYLTNHFNNL